MFRWFLSNWQTAGTRRRFQRRSYRFRLVVFRPPAPTKGPTVAAYRMAAVQPYPVVPARRRSLAAVMALLTTATGLMIAGRTSAKSILQHRVLAILQSGLV